MLHTPTGFLALVDLSALPGDLVEELAVAGALALVELTPGTYALDDSPEVLRSRFRPVAV